MKIDIENLIISNENHIKICKMLFRAVHCHALWVMNIDNHQLHILASDKSILEHYWDRKYYLQDPVFNDNLLDEKSLWNVTLGTDCHEFIQNGFLPDLYKIFNIEEFVTIEKNMGATRYYFRLFTRNNRFVFMNKLINDMPIIKSTLNVLIDKFKQDLQQQPGLQFTSFKGR